MAYKYQGIGGGAPLRPIPKFILGIVVCVAVCGYLAVIVHYAN